MSQLLRCVKAGDKWGLLLQGGIYTLGERYTCCKTWIGVLEHPRPRRVDVFHCGLCGRPRRDTSYLMFKSERFVPLPPPEQLGITEKEVRELFAPNKEKVT